MDRSRLFTGMDGVAYDLFDKTFFQERLESGVTCRRTSRRDTQDYLEDSDFLFGQEGTATGECWEVSTPRRNDQK